MTPQACLAEIERYVGDLVASGAIRTEAVRDAFLRVRRHRFLDHWYRVEADPLHTTWYRVGFDRDRPDDETLRQVYSDQSLVTCVEGMYPVSSSSTPQLMARMLEAMDLGPGLRVLEIGTGTGYNAALLAEILGDPGSVYSLEVREEIARRARSNLEDEGYGSVHVRLGDGFYGLPRDAPYDRMVVTAGCSDIAPPWRGQLTADGFGLVPLQHGHEHPLVRWTWSDIAEGAMSGRIVGSSAFMPMEGVLAAANAWQSYLVGGLAREPVREWKTPPPLVDAEGVFGSPVHRSFSFFLTLASRELWRSVDGYGLADPGAGAAVLVTGEGVRGTSRSGDPAPVERLYDRLLDRLRLWQDIGSPAVGDYELLFLPKRDVARLCSYPIKEWVIERTRHWEIVRLP